MKVNLKCFANLTETYACDYRDASEIELDEGATVGHMLRSGGFEQDRVKIIFVNGISVDAGQPLSDGDRVALVPATGGM